MNRILVVAALSAGCALPFAESKVESAAQDVHVALVDQILASRRYYAALAHLDALPPDQSRRPEIRIMRADALRLIGSEGDAEQLYVRLLATSVRASAYRGLGLIDAKRGAISRALEYFRMGVAADPVDARLRSDFGWALLTSGDLEAARFQIATAQELAPAEPRVSRNMVVLLIMSGDDAAASEVADRLRIPETERENLKREAQRLKDAIGHPTAQESRAPAVEGDPP